MRIFLQSFRRTCHFIAQLSIAAFLTACATRPHEPAVVGLVEVKYLQRNTDSSKLIDRPREVRIVNGWSTPGRAAASLGINALVLAFAGRVAAGSHSSTDELPGVPIDDVGDRNNLNNPVSDGFVSRLHRRINGITKNDPTYSTKRFAHPVLVQGGFAKLEYESLLGSDDRFRLKLDLAVFKRRESAGFISLSPVVEVDCSVASPEPVPRTLWAANNYSRIAEELNKMLDICETKVIDALPELLKY